MYACFLQTCKAVLQRMTNACGRKPFGNDIAMSVSMLTGRQLVPFWAASTGCIQRASCLLLQLHNVELVSRLTKPRISVLGGSVDFDVVVYLVDQWLSSSGVAAHPFN